MSLTLSLGNGALPLVFSRLRPPQTKNNKDMNETKLQQS